MELLGYTGELKGGRPKKEDKEKTEIPRDLSFKEPSTRDLSEILDIPQNWVAKLWWYGLAIKEDLKESGIKPKFF